MNEGHVDDDSWMSLKEKSAIKVSKPELGLWGM